MRRYSKMGVKQAIGISNKMSNQIVYKNDSGYSLYIEPDFKLTEEYRKHLNDILAQKNINNNIVTTLGLGEGYYNNDSIIFNFRIFHNKKDLKSNNNSCFDNPYNYTINVNFHLNEKGERIITFTYEPKINSLGYTNSKGLKSNRHTYIGRLCNNEVSSTDIFIPSELKFLDKDDNIRDVDIRPRLKIEYNLDTKTKKQISCNKALCTKYSNKDRKTKIYLKLTDNNDKSNILELIPQNKKISFADNSILSSGIWGLSKYKAKKIENPEKLEKIFINSDLRFKELSKDLDSISEFIATYLVSEYINMKKKQSKNKRTLVKKKA